MLLRTITDNLSTTTTVSETVTTDGLTLTAADADIDIVVCPADLPMSAFPATEATITSLDENTTIEEIYADSDLRPVPPNVPCACRSVLWYGRHPTRASAPVEITPRLASLALTTTDIGNHTRNHREVLKDKYAAFTTSEDDPAVCTPLTETVQAATSSTKEFEPTQTLVLDTSTADLPARLYTAMTFTADETAVPPRGAVLINSLWLL